MLIKYSFNYNSFSLFSYSSDSFFGGGKYQDFDAVLGMYHDQGLIPFKMLSSIEGGVNYTAGMPIIRVSPDHGPAYDIAGKGLANCKSFLKSVTIKFIFSDEISIEFSFTIPPTLIFLS